MFLSSMIGYLTDIPSFHEQIPYCINEVSKAVNTGQLTPEAEKVLDTKIERIKNDAKDGWYFEANNMFIKSFVWKVMESFENVGCIYLHRNPIDTFMSHAERGWKVGWDWILRPHWKMNRLRIHRPMSYYEALNWMWYEVRARFDMWETDFAKTFIFDFEKLNDLEEYYRMFEHFGIQYRKIDKLPEFNRNANNAQDIPVTERYQEIMQWVRPQFQHPGKEWAFPTDMESIDLDNQRKARRDVG